jgi:hypothetical protein
MAAGSEGVNAADSHRALDARDAVENVFSAQVCILLLPWFKRQVPFKVSMMLAQAPEILNRTWRQSGMHLPIFFKCQTSHASRSKSLLLEWNGHGNP